MIRRIGFVLAVPLLLAFHPPQEGAFELKDGDRVAFLGNAFFERDLKYNFLETFLTARYPNVTFRNLGWSGDTVFGHARASFGTTEDGYRRLLKDIDTYKPTVIFMAYGLNESFAGEKGLGRFRDGLNRLLESLASTGARLALISPISQDRPRPTLPDPAERNRILGQYVDVLKKTAEARKIRFVDLFSSDWNRYFPSENGIHLGKVGYLAAAYEIEAALNLPKRTWRVEIDVKGKVTARGTTITDFEASDEGIRFTATDDMVDGGYGFLAVRGLRPGRYSLVGDKIASAEEWAQGVHLNNFGANLDAFEALRGAIAEKNRIVFDQWRPHNTTYIFGFRKREQGHLQPEFPKFSPIVAEKEKRIAELRVPKPVTYVLERAR